MTRWLSLASFAVLAAALFLLPNPPAERLAAGQAGNLLSQGIEGTPETTLLDALLASAASAELPDGSRSVTLGDARVVVDGEVLADSELGETARRSIRRALRAGDSTLTILDDAAGAGITAEVLDGELRVELQVGRTAPIAARTSWNPATRSSLLPPLLAIVLAIAFRRPVVALFSGVLLGAVLVRFVHGAPIPAALALGAWDVPARYFRAELLDKQRYQIILFVVFMLAMVGVITRAGGIRGVMNRLKALASSARRTQITAYVMGLAIFFDDYANTILVGSTIRPLADRFRIAREKLAYIVDSTAAPVAGISIFSTWIAFEVSTFSAQLPEAGLSPDQGYSVFMQTLPYRFYCLLTLIFVGAVTITGRDFGPMRKAEIRARGGKVLADGAKPMVGEAGTHLEQAAGVSPKARAALLPLGAFIAVTLFEILRGGGGLTMGADLFTLQGLAQVLFNGSGSYPLMIGALVGLLVAAAMALAAGLKREIVDAAWTTLRSMGIAIVILYLAWMIGGVCGSLNTAPYLAELLHGHLPAVALPMILFVLSGIIAFSTGSSWSTMTILLPLVVGLAYNLGETAPIGGHLLMLISIGAVLEGAIFGDHCSPVSDTTVLSSIAAASDHIDHVRTQAPYAIVTMAAALTLGYLPSALFGFEGRGWLPYVCLLVGAGAVIGLLRLLGRKTDDTPPVRQDEARDFV